MKNRLICGIIIILLSAITIYAQIETDFIKLDTKSSTNLTFKNLRLFPVFAENKYIQRNSMTGKYITLKEALEKGLVKISEKIIPRDSTMGNMVPGELMNRPNREMEARINPPSISQDSNYIQNQIQIAETGYGGQVQI
ncbi:MAG: hypothetical protein M1419_07095, partial [Bacteroidetes bacterium]|nr:hypothetical protein [Bacteroidota bacterium]